VCGEGQEQNARVGYEKSARARAQIGRGQEEAQCMDAIVFKDLGVAELDNLQRPRLSNDDVLIRTRACGVCHTDIDILGGTYGGGRFPLVPGHEFAGVVEEVGSAVTQFKAGDRVAVDPNIACGECRPCRRGLINICENLGGYGVTTNGGFGEFAAVAQSNVHDIGDLPFDTAALAEPLGCVLNGLKVAGTAGVDRAIVFGAGPIGLMISLALQAQGISQLIVVDVVEKRLEFARSLDLEGVLASSTQLVDLEKSYDLAVDATGVLKVAASLTAYLANGGTALFFGVCPTDGTFAISPREVLVRQLKLVGAPSLNRNIPESLRMLKQSGNRMSRLISHRVDLAEAVPFLSGAKHDEAMKVQFVA
jgi:D-altritol 5-dehydrogenase